MLKNLHNLLLADDDLDDCMFFKEALEDLSMKVTLYVVNNGVELMQFLNATAPNLPNVLFLDLNMPLKTGFECLTEIKQDEKLKQLPVIIYSTSLNSDMVNMLYEKGAHYYICKPPEFSSLKKVIHEAMTIMSNEKPARPPKEKFILEAQQN